MSEHALREAICGLGRSMFDRGLTHGSIGDISAKLYLLRPGCRVRPLSAEQVDELRRRQPLA